MMLSYVIFLAFIIPLTLLAWLAKRPLRHPRVRTYRHAAQVQNLLNPPSVPLERLLLARSIPNQRLVNAFGLTNTFVTADVKVHKTFTTLAKALIANTGDANWRALASCTEAAINRFLLEFGERTVPFAPFIQCVTIAVILTTFFDTDLDALWYNEVVQVSGAINQRWTDSKTRDPAAMRRDDDGTFRIIKTGIDQWIPDRERYPNPLDLIIPVYETMWRVVAVAIAYTYRLPDNVLYDSAIAFAKNPTKAHFEAFGEEKSSMEAVILEVLRLHPPTRHIGRLYSEGDVGSSSGGTWWRRKLGLTPVPGLEIADIESVHLSPEYGADTTTFNPMRFHPSQTKGQDRPELYSFGFGRLRCVAAGWAPMAAGTIAAKVIEQLDEAGRTVKTGPQIGARKGWEGWEVVHSSH